MKDETIKELIQKLDELRVNTFEVDSGIHSHDIKALTNTVLSLVIRLEEINHSLKHLSGQMKEW